MIAFTIEALAWGIVFIVLVYGSCLWAAKGEPRIEPKPIDFLAMYPDE